MLNVKVVFVMGKMYFVCHDHRISRFFCNRENGEKLTVFSMKGSLFFKTNRGREVRDVRS